MIDIEYLKSVVLSSTGKIVARVVTNLQNTHAELYNALCKIEIDTEYKSISKRIYLALNNKQNEPKCESCNIRIPKFISSIQGYRRYCSNPQCCFTVKGNIDKTKNSKNKNYNKEKDDFYSSIEKWDTIDKSSVISFIENRAIETEDGLKNQWVNRRILKDHRRELLSVLKLTEDIIPIHKDEYKWSERFFILTKNLNNKCKVCNNITSYINYKIGYSTSCSRDCSQLISVTNRKSNNVIDNIVPNLEKQDYILLNKEEMIENGVNGILGKLYCNKCETTLSIDLSDGVGQGSIYCKGCYGEKNVSNEEIEFHNYLKSIYDGEIITQYRFSSDDKRTFDFYIPEHKLVIEYNGLYYHSFTDTLYKNKHRDRVDFSEERGLLNYQIYSHEWFDMNKRNQWKNIISNKLKLNNRIYARKCEIKEVLPNDKNKFLNDNHFQGEDKSNIKLGLYFDGTLVSIMTFCIPRFNKKYQWELSRFCSLSGYNVVGGASRLLSYFEKKYNPTSIISYANRNRSNGSLYSTLGFTFLKNSEPNYIYCKGSSILSRYQCQKHKLENLIDIFDENLTEFQNMINNGYRICYDCGNKVFVKIMNKSPKLV